MESRSPLEYIPQRTLRNAEAMVETIDSDLRWLSNQAVQSEEDAWGHYQASIEDTYSRHRSHAAQLNTLGRILSVKDYWENGGETDLQLQDIPLELSGQVFVQIAQTVHIQRERQLCETFQLKPKKKPAKTLSLASDYRLTKVFELKPASNFGHMADELREMGRVQLGHPRHWARPLVDYLLPLADNTQTRLEEARLGVGYGLMLAYQTYAPQLKRIEVSHKQAIDHELKAWESLYNWDEFGFDIEPDESTD